MLDSAKLSKAAEEALRRSAGEDGIAVASVTLWEIAQLSSKRRIELDSTIETFLERLQSVFVTLPLTPQIAVAGNRFAKHYPKDPADRQIGATALVHGVALITSDKRIRKSGEVRCVW